MTAGFQSRIRAWFSFRNLFFAIFLLALLLRLFVLDLKLFHHDEAVHAWFAWKLMTEGSYAYDPMYHGPFLYYVTAGMFTLFGDSDLVARI
ncbi:MAG: TIGR03663 family protein, partial [Methanoregulaceae archaeon]|nr:TIGR03663 family protein [Methanoregulaceae archaeon]